MTEYSQIIVYNLDKTHQTLLEGLGYNTAHTDWEAMAAVVSIRHS